jgi:hypothetical protein
MSLEYESLNGINGSHQNIFELETAYSDIATVA